MSLAGIEKSLEVIGMPTEEFRRSQEGLNISLVGLRTSLKVLGESFQRLRTPLEELGE